MQRLLYRPIARVSRGITKKSQIQGGRVGTRASFAVIGIVSGAAQGKSEAAKKLYLLLFIGGVAAGVIFLLCFFAASNEKGYHLDVFSFLLPVLIGILFVMLAGGSMIDTSATAPAQAAVGEEDDSDSYYG